MKTTLKSLFAVTLLACVLAASTAFAVSTKSFEGKIAGVSPDGKTVTLVNGLTLSVAQRLSPEPLKAGDQVTIMYVTRNDGTNVMTGYFIEGEDVRSR